MGAPPWLLPLKREALRIQLLPPKRSLDGAPGSLKHLQKYLNEFEYRFNRREATDMFQQTVSRLSSGEKLPYKTLIQ